MYVFYIPGIFEEPFPEILYFGVSETTNLWSSFLVVSEAPAPGSSSTGLFIVAIVSSFVPSCKPSSSLVIPKVRLPETFDFFLSTFIFQRQSN